MVNQNFVLVKYIPGCLKADKTAPPEAVKPRDLTYCSHNPEYIVTINPDRLVLRTTTTWHFQFHLMNVSILHLRYEYHAQSESRFAWYPRCYVTWCPLTTEIVALECPSSRDAALMTRYLTPVISVKNNYVKNNYNIIKHLYNEYANIIGGCNVTFDTNDCWDFPLTVSVIGMESNVTRARLNYTGDYLTPGKCSLIKPVAMDILMPFPATIHTLML